MNIKYPEYFEPRMLSVNNFTYFAVILLSLASFFSRWFEIVGSLNS